MAFLDWTDSLSVGFRLIDADHKRLIELINKLYEVGESESSRAAAESALSALVDFTKTHFVHEETLMRKTAYPQFIPHKIEHDRLSNQVDEFRKRFASGQVGLSQDTILFLRTWLCDHIMKVDTPLGLWLSKHTDITGS